MPESSYTVPIRTSPLLSQFGEITHGFFTRHGGVSTGIYHGLNVGRGSNDSKEAVEENRSRAKKTFNANELHTLYQIHSHHVVTIPQQAPLPEGDALITKQAGNMLGILTADCAPVLLYDPTNHIIAAIHAGWKGACKGICQETVATMQNQGAHPQHIVAAIGPCIQQASYEVDANFHQALCNESKENQKFFATSKRKNHYQFNLPAYVKQQLQQAGLLSQHIDILPDDTYLLENDFYSFRRKTHRNETDYGRQLSAIMLHEKNL
jgi:polyphenol oxidase